MAPKAKGTPRRVRVAALLLIAGLSIGPVGTHVYWMLGGTWGLHGSTSPGIRVVAAVVVLLLVAAVLVVLARVGFWQQGFLSDRVIRFSAWAIAGFFLLHALVSFAEGLAGMEVEWWLYGPAGLVIGLLALLVADSDRARPRFQGDTGRGRRSEGGEMATQADPVTARPPAIAPPDDGAVEIVYPDEHGSLETLSAPAVPADTREQGGQRSRRPAWPRHGRRTRRRCWKELCSPAAPCIWRPLWRAFPSGNGASSATDGGSASTRCRTAC